MFKSFVDAKTALTRINCQNEADYDACLKDIISYVETHSPSVSPVDLNLHNFEGTKEFNDLTFPFPISINKHNPRRGLGVSFKNCRFRFEVSLTQSTFKNGIEFYNCHSESDINIQTSTIAEKFTLKADGSMKIGGSLNLQNSHINCDKTYDSLEVFKSYISQNQSSNGDFKVVNCKFNNISSDAFLHGHHKAKNILIESTTFEKGFYSISPSLGDLETLTLKNVSSGNGEIQIDGIQSSSASIKIEGTTCKQLELKNDTIKKLTLSKNSIRSIKTKNCHCITSLHISESKIPILSCTLEKHRFDTLEIDRTTISNLFLSPETCSSIKVEKCRIENFDLNEETEVKELFSVKKSKIDLLNVTNSKFHKSCRLVNSTFMKAPKFYGATFKHKDATFLNSRFKDVSSDHAVSAYRELKFLMADIKNDIEEHNFSGLELNARGKRISYFSFEWVFSFFYKAINNYGRSLSQPIYILLTLTILMFFVHFYNPQYIGIHNRYEKLSLAVEYKNWSRIEKASYHSIFNSLGPLRFLVSPQWFIPTGKIGQAVLFSQNFISSILWFFILLGIRRRFKTH